MIFSPNKQSGVVFVMPVLDETFKKVELLDIEFQKLPDLSLTEEE